MGVDVVNTEINVVGAKWSFRGAHSRRFIRWIHLRDDVCNVIGAEWGSGTTYDGPGGGDTSGIRQYASKVKCVYPQSGWQSVFLFVAKTWTFISGLLFGFAWFWGHQDAPHPHCPCPGRHHRRHRYENVSQFRCPTAPHTSYAQQLSSIWHAKSQKPIRKCNSVGKI